MDDPFDLRSLDPVRLRQRPGAKWNRAGPDGWAAWVADMDFTPAPAILDRLAEVLRSGDLGYPAWPGGRSPLPELFAERMEQRYGWSPVVDHLVELADVVQCVQLAVHFCTDPGDGVVVHVPTYHPFLRTLESMDRRLVPVSPTDGLDGLDQLDERLATESARLWILCHPHNPLGHVFTRLELERIAEIADRHDLVVVSDEIHADLVHRPKSHVPFASLSADTAARTITATSASKAFNLAAMRWAVMCAGPPDVRAAMNELPSHAFGAPNLMAVTATTAAWREADEWLAAVRAVLDENRHALNDLLAHHVPGARYEIPDATYLAWIDLSELRLREEPADVLAGGGVKLSPGPQFGPSGAGHVRLNFATSPDVLATIVTAMGTILEAAPRVDGAPAAEPA